MNSASIKVCCDKNPPVIIPFKSFIVHSEVFSEQVWGGKIQKGLDYSNKYNYDSVVQFFKCCNDQDPNITPENVFGYYSLCQEWRVDNKVSSYALDFLKTNGKKLLINHILFQLEHKQDSTAQKKQLKNSLPNYINDPKLKDLPFEVLNECVDFKLFQDNQESFQKVYAFCLKYLDENQENEDCSNLFSTLDITKMEYTDLCKLTGRPYFDRSKLNDSLGHLLDNILNRTDEMPQLVKEIRGRYNQDLKEMSERQAEFEKDQQESKLLRIELEEEKKLVEQLTKQVQDIKESIFPFLKETRELHDIYVQEQTKLAKEANSMKYKASSPLYYPNYSSPSNVGWSNWKSSGGGWMLVQGGCCSSSPSYVTVAGKKKFIVSGTNSGYTYSSVFFPIKNGQNLSYNNSNSTSCQSFYIKNKGSSKVTAPDWSKATLKQWFQNYTAPCDGWLYAECGSNGNLGKISIGSTTIYICQQDCGYQSSSSAFVPIASGDSFSFYHYSYPGPCMFIPGLKDYEIGMPNYDQENVQTWNNEYEASSAGWIYAQCQSYNCNSNSSSNNPGYLIVGGCPLLISKNFSGYYDNASLFIPVAKGTKYIGQGGYQSQSISFFPGL